MIKGENKRFFPKRSPLYQVMGCSNSWLSREEALLWIESNWGKDVNIAAHNVTGKRDRVDKFYIYKEN